MPRSFDMATDYGGTVEQVYQAFGDENYWLARLAGSGADKATLESLRVGRPADPADGDHGIEVVTVQVLRSDRLPAAISQFHPGDLRVRREETWGPVIGGTANGTVVGSIPGAPVALSGSAQLSPAADSDGARLTLRATVEVRVPLVGGKIENLVGNQLMALLIAEQRFTTTWINENP